MLGDGAHRDAGVVVVGPDVVHGLQHVLALVPLFQPQNRRDGGLPAGAGRRHPPLQVEHRPLQVAVVEGF